MSVSTPLLGFDTPGRIVDGFDSGVWGVLFDAFQSLFAFLTTGIPFTTVGDDVPVIVDEPPAPLPRSVLVHFEGRFRHTWELGVVATSI